MKVNGKPYRTVWYDPATKRVGIIDQTLLPHEFKEVYLADLDAACHAIESMQVRGAPLIGALAVYGLLLAMQEDSSDEFEAVAAKRLLATRPTAINLRWAIDRVQKEIEGLQGQQKVDRLTALAAQICDEDVATCSAIGDNGVEIIRQCWEARSQDQERINILTHCNAGWLATVDWGTALAPIYKAQALGIAVHVWVDETRPRNQGANLTAWELAQQGIPHTVIVDNTGGHLMQKGLVDLCFVGSDRTTAAGDVCNKIGTYLKALAAFDNDVPFYVALPVSTIDWDIHNGLRDIPIEQRDSSEITSVLGKTAAGHLTSVQITPDASAAANYAFDVTPSRLVTALITEKGIFDASAAGLDALRGQISRS